MNEVETMDIPAKLLIHMAEPHGGRPQRLPEDVRLHACLLWDGSGTSHEAGVAYAGVGLPPERSGLLFPAAPQLHAFYNEASALLARLNAWAAQLDYACERKAGLQELVDVTERAFRNPVLLADPSMKRIACTHSTVTSDQFFNEFMELGYPTPKTYSRLDKARFYAPEYYSGELFHLNTVDDPDKQVVLQAIRLDNTLVATAYMLFENTPYLPGFEQVFAYLVQKLRLVLQENSQAEELSGQKQYGFLLRELLGGAELSEAEAAVRLGYAKRPGWGQNNVVVVDPRDKNPARLEYWRGIFAATFPGSTPVVFDGRIVAFLPLGIDKYNAFAINADALTRLDRFLVDADALAGVSHSVRRLTDLKKGYDQGGAALLLGQALESRGSWREPGRERAAFLTLFWYSDCADYDLLYRQATREDGDLLDWCCPALLRLRELDESRHSDDLRTLFVYLSSSRSLTAAAKALYVHRNTLLYRIERICDTLGVQEISQKFESQLLFSYKLLDVAKLCEGTEDVVKTAP